MTENEIRQMIVDAGILLVEKKLVQGTWGNISMRVDENTMLITPSGLDYGKTKPEDLVLMDVNTMEYKGDKKPSSEKDIHATILRERKSINAVIHSHPSYCCSVASANVEVPIMFPEMESLVGGSIKIAKYSLPSTKSLASGAIKAMEDRNGCIMSNHGVIACGVDLNAAFEVIATMEKASKLFIEKSVMEKAGKKEFNEQDMLDIFLKQNK